MLKLLLLAILPILSNAQAFVVEPQDEVITNYKTSRALLTPEQEEFLMELLAADDAILEAASRGIVDDILQALAGVGTGQIRINVLGNGQPQQPVQVQQPVPVQQQQPVVQVQFQQQPAQVPLQQPAQIQQQPQPIHSILNSASAPGLEKALETNTSYPQGANPPPTYAPILSPGSSQPVMSPGSTSQTGNGNATITTIGGNNNHLFMTISSVISNSNRRNVTGIVDEALRIGTPAPIREFVTGILNVAYCNSIRRLLGRC